MRVVGGRLRGRRLVAPESRDTRPTADRTRESLFNILESRYRSQLIGGRVADLYAGTGALGIEALSRGARHATFVEQAPDALRILRENIETLGLSEDSTVIRGDAVASLARLGPVDLLFADPPYGSGESQKLLDHIATIGCISENGALILEDARGLPGPHHPSTQLVDERQYGKTCIRIYRQNPRETD